MDDVPRLWLQLNAEAGDSLLWHFLLIFFLILVNGFFSASEMAVVTLNETRIRREAAEKDKRSQRLLRFVEDQSAFLATIQIGVTLAGFLSAAFGAERLAPLLADLLDPERLHPGLQTTSTILITLVISFLSLIFGELVPKRIGMSNPEAFAKNASLILSFFSFIFSPLTKVLAACSHGVCKLLSIPEQNASERISEEEIRLLTEASRESGSIHSDEADMINKIFELDDKELSEIMTPRTQVLALPKDAEWSEVLEAAAYGPYSRIPVYDEDIDDIIGILHIRDLLALKDKEEEHKEWIKLLHPASFVAENKTVSRLFTEMRQKHLSLVIVLDEYGGMEGVISMEDILEEIVGDIEDEYDDKAVPGLRQDDGSYILDGRLTPEEAGVFVPELAKMEEDDNYDTIAGFVLSLLDRIPSPDEHPTVHFHDLSFTVLEMDDRRISKIRVSPIKSEEADK